MLNEVSGQTQSQFNSVSDMPPAPGPSGKLIGKAVVEVETPQSIFQEAMEEMTCNMNRSKDYALRNLKERNQSERMTKNRLKAFRRIAEDSGNFAIDSLRESIERHPKREEILEHALEEFEEADQAWAALEKVRDELAASNAHPDVLKEVDEALSLLDMRYGAAIRAGVCGALVAADSYFSLGNPLDLGTTYRKSVLEFTSSLDLYTFIQENYPNNFDKAVEFLYASLTSDMNCDQPSVDIAELQSLNKSLGRLRSFQSADSLCDKMLTRWQDVYHVTNNTMKSLDLLGNILKMGEQSYLSASSVQNLAQSAGAPDVEHRIYFLQELLQNLRDFSPLVFDNDNEGRSRVLDAVQEAVDNAVHEEDMLLS